MRTFITLNRGKSIGTAKIIGVCIDPHLIRAVAQHILAESEPSENFTDPIIGPVRNSRRIALEVIISEGGKDEATRH